VGVIFKSSNYSTLTITTGDKEERYIKLAEFPFDSTRKCMSVIVRDCVSRAVTIYTKGADNVMLEKIIFTENSIKERVVSDLYKYSCEGYRTLVIASKKLNESEYRGFETVYK
jgi:phospholipid-translocating ATPase